MKLTQGHKSVPPGKITMSILLFGGIMIASANAAIVFAAPSNSTDIHLTKAQEKSLNIQTVKLKTQAIRPTMTLYGELQRNPDGVFMLSSPLSGVVLNMPGKHWPQIGAAVIRGTSLAGIKPVVRTTLQITLALELTKVKADLASAKVAELTSAAAYAREKSLYSQNKAVSLQRVQAAQAAFAGAHAREQADMQSIAAISRQLKTKAGGFLPLPIFQSGMIVIRMPLAVFGTRAVMTIPGRNIPVLPMRYSMESPRVCRSACGPRVRGLAFSQCLWPNARMRIAVPMAIAPESDAGNATAATKV